MLQKYEPKLRWPQFILILFTQTSKALLLVFWNSLMSQLSNVQFHLNKFKKTCFWNLLNNICNHKKFCVLKRATSRSRTCSKSATFWPLNLATFCTLKKSKFRIVKYKFLVRQFDIYCVFFVFCFLDFTYYPKWIV